MVRASSARPKSHESPQATAGGGAATDRQGELEKTAIVRLNRL